MGGLIPKAFMLVGLVEKLVDCVIPIGWEWKACGELIDDWYGWKLLTDWETKGGLQLCGWIAVMFGVAFKAEFVSLFLSEVWPIFKFKLRLFRLDEMKLDAAFSEPLGPTLRGFVGAGGEGRSGVCFPNVLWTLAWFANLKKKL